MIKRVSYVPLMNDPLKRSFLFAFGKRSVWCACGALIFALCYGPLILFPGLPIQVGVSTSGFLASALFLCVIAAFEPGQAPIKAFRDVVVPLLGIYLLSELSLRFHGFVQCGEVALYWLPLALLLFLLLRQSKEWFYWGICFLTVAAAVVGFVTTAQSRLLFSDDHPSFLYRLIQLKDNFPNIPFYNPLWNAGVEAREFFASGVLNVFILFSPIIYLFEVTSWYNHLVVMLLFVVVPAAVFLSAKLLRLPREVAAVAMILSLTFSLRWYRWALSYGTLGFILSAALVPLNLVLFSLLLRKDLPLRLSLAITIAISYTLMFLWSPSGLLFAPLLALAVLRVSTLVRQKVAWGAFILILVLNVPWAITFLKVSNVADFVAVTSDPEASLANQPAAARSPVQDLSRFKIEDREATTEGWPKELLTRLRDHILPINPLVFFIGIPGLFLFREKTARTVFLIAGFSAALLGLLGPMIKPQLELERMILLFGMILVLPAAHLFIDLVQGFRRSVVTCGLMAMLALSPGWIWKVTSNTTSEKFLFASPIVQELAAVIQQNAADGRTLFAGFTLHELSGGHVAPLAYWTGKPLIAMSYQHDRWRYTDVIPEEYRGRKEQGVLDYLDIMNVSSVVTHDRFWRSWFNSRPELFERTWQSGAFHLFRRRGHVSSYFLEGQGEVTSHGSNELQLKVFSKDAIVKFQYLPFLLATNCELSPAKLGQSLALIRLSNCDPSLPVNIKAKSMISRLF